MLYSKTAEYAIRALTVMALRPPGTFFQVKQIAALEPISPSFLSKIMRDLTRARILKSVRGPSGGFYLARKASDISLWDVVTNIDSPETFDSCLLGLEECLDENPCPMHYSFKPLREATQRYLRTCSIEELSDGYKKRHQDRVIQLDYLLSSSQNSV